MAPKIFDLNGVEQDMDWLCEHYGHNLTFLEAAPVGGKKFALVEIRVIKDRPQFEVIVLNEAGGPQHSQGVINTWPTDDPAGSFMDRLDVEGGPKSLWGNIWGCVRQTLPTGFIDFGYGGGSRIMDLASGGVHTIFVGSPSLTSDGLSGLGWLAGTHYEAPGLLKFQIVSDQDPPPPAKLSLRCKIARWLCPGGWAGG